MKVTKIIIILTLMYLSAVMADQATTGPILKNFGPVYPVSEMDEPLPKDFTYQVVFDVYQTATEVGIRSSRLESVARFINMHAQKGVKLEQMQIAVVFHGKATKDILTDVHYKEKFGVDNPNGAMIEALAKVGVKHYVCGQSAAYSNYQRKDIRPEIKMALSAMTQLSVLQQQGYSLLP